MHFMHVSDAARSCLGFSANGERFFLTSIFTTQCSFSRFLLHFQFSPLIFLEFVEAELHWNIGKLAMALPQVWKKSISHRDTKRQTLMPGEYPRGLARSPPAWTVKTSSETSVTVLVSSAMSDLRTSPHRPRGFGTGHAFSSDSDKPPSEPS
jgi:hypothetical protein